MARIEIHDLAKTYDGKVDALANFSLAVEDGEFCVLVGPSGCGKSTALKILAGLELATAGTIMIDGNDVTDLGPGKRDIAMVFQNYALYPHMTVASNIGFGLKMRGVNRSEVRRRVAVAANMLELSEFLDRKPRSLSGGQRQRVALGRAIVREPKAFLMDEPLSNLDAKLRVQTRSEIVRLQRRLGVTTIYVTHDQTEALTMSDKIVVMRGGRIQQTGTPDDLFHRPANLFVAGFIGSPAMNFFSGTVSLEDGRVYTTLADRRLEIALPSALMAERSGKPTIFGIRPEHIGLGGQGNEVEFEVALMESLGSEKIVHVQLPPDQRLSGYGENIGTETDDENLVARVIDDRKFRSGERLCFNFPADKIYVFDPVTKQRVG